MATTVKTTPQTTEPIPGQVADKLRSLRRAVVSWLFVEGLAVVLPIAGAVVAADLLIDWYFRMDLAQRGVCLTLMMITVAWATFRFLIRPLLRPVTDDMLILQVEQQHSELGQSLISAVQFARMSHRIESLGLSSHMVAATIDRGTHRAQDVDFCDVLDQGRFRRNLLLCVCIVLGMVGFAFARPDVAKTWGDRNLLLGDAQWPQDTHLRIVTLSEGEDAITLPRGDDLLLQAEILKGLVPSVVEVEFRSSGSSSGRQRMVCRDESLLLSVVDSRTPAKPRFEFTFKNVLDEFELRVCGGDALTEWIPVRLVERPVVADLSLVVTPPDYTLGKRAVLRRGQGPYDVYPGSRLKIIGKATKPLSAARLRIAAKGKPPADLEMAIGANGPKSFSILVMPDDLKAAVFQIEVTDRQGRRSKRPEDFVVRIRRDRAPTVRSRLAGISSMIISKARIPIASTITDDLAVASAQLVYQTKTTGDDDPLTEHSGSREFEEIENDFGKPKIGFTYVLEAESLELAVGMNVGFHVEATDNNNVSGPGVGKSHSFQLRVVTEEELRSDLLRREKEQRRQFEDLSITQADLLTEVRAMAADLAGNAPMSKQQRDLLLKIQKRQSQASQRCEMIAGWLEEITTEAANNRLEGSQGRYQKTMREKIIQPMRRLAKLDVPNAARQIGEARRAGNNDPAGRGERLAETIATQRRITTTMVDILKYMAKSEGFQEVVNMLYRAIDIQGEVNRATQDRIGGGVGEPSSGKRDKSSKATRRK